MFKSISSILLSVLLLGLQAYGQGTADPAGLTLSRAIELALKNHLQTRIGQERIVESRSQRGAVRSALLPNISGAASQANVTGNLAAQGLTSSVFPGLPAFIGPYSRFDARFEMVQSLFNLEYIERYRASREAVHLAEQENLLARQRVIAITSLAYIATLEAAQSVAAAEANVQLGRRLLDLATNQRNAGIATGVDVARAETRLAAQQVQLAQAKTNQDTARLRLLRVIGAPLGSAVSPAETMRFEPRPPHDVRGAVRQALDGRLELQVASVELRIAEVERKAAIGQWMPSVSAFGDYGSSGIKPNEVDLPTRVIGIRLDVPIFNGGRTRSEIQIATSRVRQAEIQLADLRAEVEKDVRQALDELATREEQMRAAQKSLDLAQRELSLAQDRFQNGRSAGVRISAGCLLDRRSRKEPAASPLRRGRPLACLRRLPVAPGQNAATFGGEQALVAASDGRISTPRYNQIRMSLVVVGSVAYDGVETPHGKVDRMLGGACTYISLAASFFTKPHIVAVVGDDFAQEDVDLLASRGIDLEGLERVPGKTFFWAGVYSHDMNERETLTTELNVFAEFQPKLPASYRTQPYLLLGNIQPSLQKQVRAQMKNLQLAGGDTMNYWISDYRTELAATIAEWDFLLINDSEAKMLSGESNLRRAAAKILEMGPHTLVIKRGEYGAVLFRRDGHFMAPGYLLEEVFDPTGAGDCFAGGFIGYLASRGLKPQDGKIDAADLRRAVIYGSVMGSFCCEQFGVDRFRTLTRAEIDDRYNEFKTCTDF